jgi:hypothetical protein
VSTPRTAARSRLAATMTRRQSWRSTRAPTGRANSSQGRVSEKVIAATRLGDLVNSTASSGRATWNNPSARLDAVEDPPQKPEAWRAGHGEPLRPCDLTISRVNDGETSPPFSLVNHS